MQKIPKFEKTITMKRIAILLAFAASAACSQPEKNVVANDDIVPVREAICVRQNVTEWNSGDRISVFVGVGERSCQENVAFTNIAGNTFAPEESSVRTNSLQNKCVALFPYNSDASYDADSDVVSMSLPSTQTFADVLAGGVMVAQAGAPTFHFRPICGILSLRLTGEGSIRSIVMNTPGVCGRGEVDMSREYPVFVPSQSSAEAITLDCGAQGIELDNIVPTDFRLLVPVGKYISPRFVVTDTEGNEYIYVSETVVVRIESESSLQPFRFSSGKVWPIWPEAGMEDKTYIANCRIQIGVDMARGGGIFHFSESMAKKNLINHADAGRLIQQSYYGNSDGSMWAGTKWNWNPVQGGGYLPGYDAQVESSSVGSDFIEVTTIPMHWAACVPLDECRMTERITLEGDVAHLHFKFAYSGTTMHTSRDQELPAVFCDASLPHLCYYCGNEPWTSDALTSVVPADLSATGKNEYVTRTEDWAAYVDDDGWGVGVYSPGTMSMTYYRFGTNTAGGGFAPECCYFAPIRKFAITPGHVYEYDVYLKAGTLDEIRSVFYKLHKQLDRQR